MDGLQKEYAELIKTDKNLAIQASIILPATLISYSFGSKLPKKKHEPDKTTQNFHQLGWHNWATCFTAN